MIATRGVAAALAAITLAACPAQAQSRHGGFHGGGFRHGHHGLVWGGVGIGIGIGFADGDYLGGPSYYGPPWYPPYVVAPPPMAYAPAPVPAAPDPIFYPRNGQTAAQTEADRRDCNRWASTQQSAMNDASVFHRATLACMEGRGYSVR
jgi:hypothetical protein